MERVINGFWFHFTDPGIRDQRSSMEPKAPIWGEGFRGQIAKHPLQAQIEEMDQINKIHEAEIVEDIQIREKQINLQKSQQDKN
jgi:hypothetical protein